MANGKAPLDHVVDQHEAGDVSTYVDLARRQGDQAGRKEMAMTRRPRAEDDSTRAKRFVDIERSED